MIANPTTNLNPFDLIWRRFPERLNRRSSTWWYFLLLPKQAEGYGPRQMMLSIDSIAGDWFKINHVKHPGLSLDSDEAHFNSIVLGWAYDEQQMQHDFLHHSTKTTLSPSGSIVSWTPPESNQRYGGEIKAAGDKPFGMVATFIGAKGQTQFEVWGDPAAKITSPEVGVDFNTAVGGIQMISWCRINFAGEFSLPSGTEYLEGIGYFQRVCFDLPLFPWKWIWSAFADGTVFSCYVPYIGLQLFRRGDRFFPNMLEQATMPIRQIGGYIYSDDFGEIRFDKARVTPYINGKLPQFLVECRSKNGDFIRYRAVVYSHAQILVERPLLRGLWHSRYNHNDYLFRIEDLVGSIGGKPLDTSALGNGFGSIEYSWGLALH